MQIIIEDSQIPTVKLVTLNTTVKSGEASSVFEEYLGIHGIETGIFMPAVRWISSDKRSVILERKPFLHSTIFNPPSTLKKSVIANVLDNIPVPWHILGLRFSEDLASVTDAYMFIRNAPIAMGSDILHVPFFPNVYSNCKLCLGDSFYNTQYPEFYSNAKSSGSLTLANATAYVLTFFWGCPFNNEVLQWLDPWRLPANIVPAEYCSGPHIVAPDASPDAASQVEVANHNLAVNVLNTYQSFQLASFVKTTDMIPSTNLVSHLSTGEDIDILPKFDTVDDLIKVLSLDVNQDFNFQRLANAIKVA